MDHGKNGRGTSRRQFFKGAAVGTLGIAGLALTGCGDDDSKSSTTGGSTGTQTSIPSSETFDSQLYSLPKAGTSAFVATPIDASKIVNTVATDVLVLGAGISGACTAASAAENGLAVTVLEKGDSPTFHGLDIAGLEDSVHQAAGLVVSKEEVIEALLTLSNWRADPLVIKTWADHCSAAVDWLIANMDGKAGVPYLPFKSGNYQATHTKWFGTAVSFPGMMQTVVPALLDYATSKGAQVLYSTPAVQLVKDASGAVTGAIAQTAAGYVKYTAAKGVVLCTGSYEHNPDRMKKYLRPRDLALGGCLSTTLTDTGDGHEMGLAVGGIEDEYPHTLMTDPQGVPSLGLGVRVNTSGKRFVAEFTPYNFYANAVQNQLGGYVWQLTDANGLAAFQKAWNDTSLYATPEDCYAQFTKTGISANTVEELAGKLGVPAANLVETVARWNQFCANGVDEDFGLGARFLSPLSQAPFYALRETVDALVTVSGLRITEKSEVIDGATRLPIPGLYAVGNVSGSMFSGTYSHNVNGVSHSRCVTFGYLLGRRLAGVAA